MSESDQTYYYASPDGQPAGPVSKQELRRLLKQAHKAAALLSTLTPVPSDNGHNGDNGVEAGTGEKNRE